MAVTITEAVAENIATTNASSYTLGAFTPAASSFLVVVGAAMGTVTGVELSGGGLNWHKIINGTSALDSYAMWAVQCATSPPSTTITMTPGASATGVILMAFQITGHDTSRTAIRQVATGSGTASANPNCTFDTNLVTTNGYIAAWLGTIGGSNVSAPPNGSWTEIADAGFTSPVRSASGAFRNSGETGTTLQFTVASQNWVCMAVEIYDLGAGPKRHHMLGMI